jgi:hypothetical protein
MAPLTDMVGDEPWTDPEFLASEAEREIEGQRITGWWIDEAAAFPGDITVTLANGRVVQGTLLRVTKVDQNGVPE